LFIYTYPRPLLSFDIEDDGDLGNVGVGLADIANVDTDVIGEDV